MGKMGLMELEEELQRYDGGKMGQPVPCKIQILKVDGHRTFMIRNEIYTTPWLL